VHGCPVVAFPISYACWSLHTPWWHYHLAYGATQRDGSGFQSGSGAFFVALSLSRDFDWLWWLLTKANHAPWTRHTVSEWNVAPVSAHRRSQRCARLVMWRVLRPIPVCCWRPLVLENARIRSRPRVRKLGRLRGGRDTTAPRHWPAAGGRQRASRCRGPVVD
jgi:hypothetical protein